MKTKVKCERCEKPVKVARYYDGMPLCAECWEVAVDALCKMVAARVGGNA